MARSCMKTRTSSYKLLRKRHNYGRRGSEPSALAHIGRALNDELDTVYARAPLREVCPQERRERKKERIRVYIYIYIRAACVLRIRRSSSTAYPFSSRFLFAFHETNDVVTRPDTSPSFPLLLPPSLPGLSLLETRR